MRASESVLISGPGPGSISMANVYGDATGEGEDAGDAGTITIETKSLLLKEGARINSDTSNGGGEGGSILIRGFGGGLADSVHISGAGKIMAGAMGVGQGGSIDIRANRVALTGGGIIDAISRGKGDAGAIAIQAPHSIHLEGQSKITTTAENEGDAGEIHLETNLLCLDGESFITSESTSEAGAAGNAGRIFVEAGDSVELFGNSALTTEAKSAGGGQIHVVAGGRIHLLDGRITSSVLLGEGKGGDVRAGSEFVILNNGEITANAEAGDGGAIFIETENYFKSVGSMVSAASRRGNDGTVTIQAPDLDITGGLVTLPADVLDVTRWVETPCTERSGESVSRFVVKGWDAAPARPDDLRPFDLFWFEEEGDDPGRTSPPVKGLFKLDEPGREEPDCPGGNC